MFTAKLTAVFEFATGSAATAGIDAANGSSRADDATFCHRVSEALSKGWLLYGSPTLTFDATKGRVICGQAITKDVEDIEYSKELKLGEL